MKAELIDYMGSDLSVVNAARVSFDKVSELERETFETMGEAEAFGDIDYDYVLSDRWFGGYPASRLSDSDAKLLNYLASHNHWTPFAHTAVSLRVKAPVPIRTQCFKHKQGFVENEESRRYIKTRPEVFVPEVFRSAPEGSIKQGSGGQHPDSNHWRTEYILGCKKAVNLYESMVADGVCPEQARFVLPQGVEVNWIWTGNLYAFANFYLKRSDANAQKEVRDLASYVKDIIEPLFPVSWRALVEE